MSTSTSLAKNRKTPGVYITEFPAFPPSIVGVATAVPIFVGYTQSAADPVSRKQLYDQAVPISSMADYLNYFGQGFSTSGAVVASTSGDYDFQAGSVAVDAGELKRTTGYYKLGTPIDATHPVSKMVPQFNLFAAMQMFYANGGGNCYVVSVGNYKGTQSVEDQPDLAATPADVKVLLQGIDVAADTKGATMLVVPDACLLADADYGKLAVAMLNQAARLKDRVAILDLPSALDTGKWSATDLATQAAVFYEKIAPASAAFSYGAAYAPALQSTLLSVADIDYTNLCETVAGQFDSATQVNNLLTSQALVLYPPDENGAFSDKFVQIAARIGAAFPVVGTTTPYGTPPDTTVTVGGPIVAPATVAAQILVSLPNTALCPVPGPADLPAIQTLDQYLGNALPLTGQIEQIMADQLNVVPPCGAMAGIWSQNDANRGVWNAPANLSINSVVAPMVVLNDAQQGDYNVPLNGNAIDILRAMPGRGVVVWGARTLDGNSQDTRYIQVRRTLNYVEQSIKTAMQPFVFAANDGGTWATVTAAVAGFLTQFWQAGGLMGDKASDAFSVTCGVPTTMSGSDVLNGYMVVNVSVALIHPAEFIELTFKQTMQGA